MIKQALHYTFLREHTLLFCDFHHCTVFDAKQCIVYTCYFLVIFKDDLVLHDEQFGTKENVLGLGWCTTLLNMRI